MKRIALFTVCILFGYLVLFFGMDAVEIQYSSQKSQDTLQKVMELSCQLRDSSPEQVKSEKKSNNFVQLRQSVLKNLDDYTIQNSLEKSIQNFLYKTFYLDQIELNNIQDILGLEESGHSKDSVFFVNGKSEKPILVVKAYVKTDRQNGNFIPELSALEFFQKHSLSNAAIELPLAVGKCTCQGITYALLAKNYVSGRMIEEYLSDLFRYPMESKEYQRALIKAKQAVELLGSALGELHTLSTRPGVHSPEIPRQIRRRLTRAVTRGGKKLKEIDTHALKKYVAGVIHNYMNTPFSSGYCHGDAGPRNFLYDEYTERLTMIDISNFHLSIDRMGHPIGDPARDITKFEERMESMQSCGLPASAYLNLRDTFRKGYLSSAKVVPSPIQLNFYYVCMKLNRIISHADYETKPTKKEQKEHKRLFNMSLTFFNKRLLNGGLPSDTEPLLSDWYLYKKMSCTVVSDSKPHFN